MGLDRIRNTLVTFVWYHIFYFIIVLLFFVGFHLQQCSIFWIDRLYILVVFPIVTAISLAVAPGNWWGRFFHWLVTMILMIFFIVIFFAYLLPGFILANCQPSELNIPDVCSGGKCNNPFNDLRWSCIFNNTAEAQLCDYPCTLNLCDTGVGIADLTVKSSHLWIFVFVIIFIILMFISLLLLWNINALVKRARSEMIAGIDVTGSLGEELRNIENIYPYMPGLNMYGDASQPHLHGNAYDETNHDSYLTRKPNMIKNRSLVANLLENNKNKLLCNTCK